MPDFESLFGSELSQTDEPTNQFVTAGRLVDIVSNAIKSYGCEHRDAIIGAITPVYNRFVRPYAIPDFIDTLILSQLLTAANVFADAYCQGDDTDVITEPDGPTIEIAE